MRPADVVGRLGESALALGMLCGAGFLGFRVLHPPEPWSTPIVLVDSVGPPPASPSGLSPLPGAPLASARLGFTGDLMQHRLQAGDDFTRSYAALAPLLRGFDLTVGNLEFPVDSAAPVGPGPRSATFNGSPAHLAALAAAGFDLVSTANNHAWDQGLGGIDATVAALTARGLTPVGTGGSARDSTAPVVRDAGGIRVAFLAYTFPPNARTDPSGASVPPSREAPVATLVFNDWTAEFRTAGVARIRADVARARAAGAEFVVAFVHWGREWHLEPDADQRRAAHDLVDAGVDLVVGAHPHVLEPPELYRGRLIAYSLGDFIADFHPLAARTGAVLAVDIAKTTDGVRATGFAFHPTLVVSPGHIVTPVHASDPGDARAAWRWARARLGTAVAP
ncbi:MAG TPA: CapA family protein [Gemmatimonadales bacterium]|nr:CapA family protein [Gemmatimonadales bacterium]